MVLADPAKVLITVKAAPEPSKSYVDTVCVAGLRIDRSPNEWVRIYPIPFRHLDADSHFRKGQVIDVDLVPSTRDPRSESYRPLLPSIRPDGKAHGLAARGAVLEAMVRPSMCDLETAVLSNANSQSLGLIRVRQVTEMSFESHGPWSEEQLAAIAGQPDLFSSGPSAPPLQPPRFKVKYEFLCVSDGCPGHSRRILDWELVMLERRYRARSDEDTKTAIRRKFQDEICGPSRRPHFFVGNYADPKKRRYFSVLGYYSPPATAGFGETLF